MTLGSLVVWVVYWPSMTSWRECVRSDETHYSFSSIAHGQFRILSRLEVKTMV